MQYNARTLLWLWLIIVIAYRLIICFSARPELTNGESNNVWNAINVSKGKAIYSNPEDLPLEVFQYTPLSQFPIILSASIFNISDRNYVYKVTSFGRCIALLMNLISFYLLFLCCLSIQGISREMAAVIGLTGLSIMTHSLFSIRPDAMALMTTCLSYFLFVRGYFHRQHVYLVLSAILVAFSFLVKQDAIILAGPLGLFLLLNKEWRLVLLFGGISIVTLVVLFFTGELIFGDYFLYSITKGVQNPYSLSQSISVFDRAFSFYGFSFILGNGAVAYYLFTRKTNTQVFLLVLICISFEVIAFITSSKVGSWVNYYTPFIVFSCILVGLFITQFIDKPWPTARPLLMLAFGLASFFFIIRQVYVYTYPFLKMKQEYIQYGKRYDQIMSLTNEIGLKPDEKLFVGNQLHRNFLALNSIAVNTEYYGISSFDYTTFKQKQNKEIDYLLIHKDDEQICNAVISIFQIDLSAYNQISVLDTDFQVFRKK